MKLRNLLFSTIAAATVVAQPLIAQDKTAATTEAKSLVCPITGKPANPNITVSYEGKTYAFADEASRTKFNQDREQSLYHQIGGEKALNAAVELFYKKVEVDPRIKHIFEDINMAKQKRKQKEFLHFALGGPVKWTGKDMRKAHSTLDLTEEHFNAVAENLQKTLEELNVKKDAIEKIMTAVGSLKADVLNLPKK